MSALSYFGRSWFLQHFLTWFSLFVLASSLEEIQVHTVIVLGAVTAVGWELLERKLESMYGKPHEPWWDRWVLDPIADLSGSFAGWSIGILIRWLLFGHR